MKKNFILFACMACLFGMASVKAENAKSIHYKEGYRADVELSCNIHEIWHFSTSHGYAFGNGLYVGGGAGFSAEYVPDLKSDATMMTPVFADIKFSFLNCLASPVLSLRAGSYIDVTNIGLRAFVNPAIGVNIGRFTIKGGYEYQLGFWRYNDGVSKHHVKCGLVFNF